MTDDKAHIRHRLDLSGAEWIRGEPAGVTLDEVVEYAFVEHTDGATYVALRRSPDVDGTIMVFTMSEWDAFVKGVDGGEFNDLGV